MTADAGTLQNKAIFARSLSGMRLFGAAQQHVGRDAEAGDFADGMLRRLGLEFAGRLDPGHQRRVDADRLVAAEVVTQLSERLDERQAFDVADRAADLANHEIDIIRVLEREFLDGVGDVRDDLHRRAQIIAAPLLRDDVAVDAPGGDVVRLARGHAGVALVMTEIEVGLGPIVGHEDLAVLIRRHRPRIDVQIGVELPDADLVATRLKQRP